jgi:hypothetical protein
MGYSVRQSDFIPAYLYDEISFAVILGGKIYGLALIGRLWEREAGSSTMRLVADGLSYCTDLGVMDLGGGEKIYATGLDGKVYVWNGNGPSLSQGGTGAWDIVATISGEPWIYSIAKFNSKLYVGTGNYSKGGLGSKLYQTFDGGTLDSGWGAAFRAAYYLSTQQSENPPYDTFTALRTDLDAGEPILFMETANYLSGNFVFEWEMRFNDDLDLGNYIYVKLNSSSNGSLDGTAWCGFSYAQDIPELNMQNDAYIFFGSQLIAHDWEIYSRIKFRMSRTNGIITCQYHRDGTWRNFTDTINYSGNLYPVIKQKFGYHIDQPKQWFFLTYTNIDADTGLPGTGTPGGIGSLYELNGSEFTLVAPRLGDEIAIHFLLPFQGGLYGCTAFNAKLLLWNGVDAWTSKVTANRYLDQKEVYTICTDGVSIYGGTFPSGYLFRWNGVDGWTKIADRPDGILGHAHFVLYNPYRGSVDILYSSGGVARYLIASGVIYKLVEDFTYANAFGLVLLEGA